MLAPKVYQAVLSFAAVTRIVDRKHRGLDAEASQCIRLHLVDVKVLVGMRIPVVGNAAAELLSHLVVLMGCSAGKVSLLVGGFERGGYYHLFGGDTERWHEQAFGGFFRQSRGSTMRFDGASNAAGGFARCTNGRHGHANDVRCWLLVFVSSLVNDWRLVVWDF